MTDNEMAVAALRMLMDFQPEDHVEVTLEFSTIYHHPELQVMHFDDELNVVKAEFYSAHQVDSLSRLEECIHGSFEDGFKRLEELIHEQ